MKRMTFLRLVLISAVVGVARPLPTASNESSKEDDGYQYEGQEGLLKHMKDVQNYTMNQVGAVAGNVGFAWGGLTANAATQALKKTSQFVGSSTRAMNNALGRLQNFGNRTVRFMVRGINFMGRGVSSRLESLSDMLDRLVAKISKRRKRKRQQKEAMVDQHVDSVNVGEDHENQPPAIFDTA